MAASDDKTAGNPAFVITHEYFEELRSSLELGYGGTFEQLDDYLARQ